LAKKAEEKAQRQAEKLAKKATAEQTKLEKPKAPKMSEEELSERKKNIQERTKMIFPIFSQKYDMKSLRQEVKVELNKNLPVQETIKRLL